MYSRLILNPLANKKLGFDLKPIEYRVLNNMRTPHVKLHFFLNKLNIFKTKTLSNKEADPGFTVGRWPDGRLRWR